MKSKKVICMQLCVMKPGNCIFKYSYFVIIDYHSIMLPSNFFY